MNRRSFLRSTATVAGAAALFGPGPRLMGVDDKAGSKKPRVGEGAYVYECDHAFGQLPGELEWQTTHNVCLDSSGLIYITHQGHKGKKGLDTTFVFDSTGKFVKSFGKAWHGGGHGIDIRKEGSQEFIYFTNTWANPKVVKTDLKGEVVWTKERPDIKEYAERPDPRNPSRMALPNYNPTNVAFCPDGSFFIGDGYGSNYMMKYDKDGKLLKTFGGSGKGDGQFATPHGNWIDNRDPAKPVLVVCDRANARLQWFDLNGKFLRATKSEELVLFPANIDTNADVMLVPDLYARITLLDKAGKLITHLGEDEAWRKKVVGSRQAKAPERPVRAQPKEWLPGRFVHPHDACFDAAGNILVAEWVEGGRISFLKKVS